MIRYALEKSTSVTFSCFLLRPALNRTELRELFQVDGSVEARCGRGL